MTIPFIGPRVGAKDPRLCPVPNTTIWVERVRHLFRRRSGGEAAAPRSRTVEVGWLIDSEKATFIWEGPRRIKRNDPPPTHAKSANFCPAVLDYEARMFDVPCPIDVRLAFRKDDKGKPALINLDRDMSSVRSKHLNEMLVIVNPREWRHPDRPVLQIVTPYVFVADEQVYMTQMPPVAHYQAQPWPGILIGGRLPIHIWPRQMMWAFEWWDTSKELVLRRGEPWFYVRFEPQDPSRPVRLVEAEMTPELREYTKGLSAVSNYVDRTFSLYKIAEARRPVKLLQPKQRSAATSAEIPSVG